MIPEEFQQLSEKAKAGDKEAMFNVAIAYRDGDGVEQNDDEFFKWVKRAASLEYPPAMLEIAIAYNEGNIVEQSNEQSFNWIEKAANAKWDEWIGKAEKAANTKWKEELEDKKAQAAYELANAYLEGRGTSTDPEKSVEWLDKAANLKHRIALYEMAIRYKDGNGVAISEEQFFKLIEESAEKGYEDAMLELAFAYEEREDWNNYFIWLEKAADAENAEARFHLAFAYKDGKGTDVDMGSFFDWLRKAAEEERPYTKEQPTKKVKPDALFHLAIAYKEGEGTEENVEEYLRTMERAADAGHSAAMYNLAIHYLEDENDRDLQQFSKWIEEASKAGYRKAFVALGMDDLINELKISPKDERFKEALNLQKDLYDLYEKVMEIKRSYLVDKEHTEPIYHFTKFDMLDSILPYPEISRKNHFRLYNFAYMNDPEEGMRLLAGEENPLNEFFTEDGDKNNPLSWENHDFSVYIGAFTFKGDELIMWQSTYGANGEGYCIGTPIDAFDQEEDSELAENLHGDESVRITEGMRESNEDVSRALYKVLYEEDEVKETLKKLKPILDKIKAKKTKLLENVDSSAGNEKTIKALNRTVRLIISNILYLYKNKEYQFEEEARMISSYDIRFGGLELDIRKKPSRIYIESPEFLLSEDSKIIIGPRVREKTVAELDLKCRLAKHGFDNVSVSRSELTDKYR